MSVCFGSKPTLHTYCAALCTHIYLFPTPNCARPLSYANSTNCHTLFYFCKLVSLGTQAPTQTHTITPPATSQFPCNNLHISPTTCTHITSVVIQQFLFSFRHFSLSLCNSNSLHISFPAIMMFAAMNGTRSRTERSTATKRTAGKSKGRHNPTLLFFHSALFGFKNYYPSQPAHLIPTLRHITPCITCIYSYANSPTPTKQNESGKATACVALENLLVPHCTHVF